MKLSDMKPGDKITGFASTKEPNLKERVEELMRKAIAQLAFDDPKEPPFILVDALLALIQEDRKEIVERLRACIQNALPMMACSHSPKKALVERKVVLTSFDLEAARVMEV